MNGVRPLGCPPRPSRWQAGALHFRVLQLAGVPKEMKTMRYSGHPLPMLAAPCLLTRIYIT